MADARKKPTPGPDPATSTEAEVRAVQAAVTRLVRALLPRADKCVIAFSSPDGRKGRLSVDLDAPDPVGTDGLSDTERAILAILKAAPTWLKRTAVATEMDRETVTGSFGVAFRALVGKKRKIVKFGDYYTDDPTKPLPEGA